MDNTSWEDLGKIDLQSPKCKIPAGFECSLYLIKHFNLNINICLEAKNHQNYRCLHKLYTNNFHVGSHLVETLACNRF